MSLFVLNEGLEIVAGPEGPGVTHRPSGRTMKVPQVTADLLSVIRSGPVSLQQLTRWSTDFQLGADALQSLLRTLLEQGLIAQVAAPASAASASNGVAVPSSVPLFRSDLKLRPRAKKGVYEVTDPISG